MIPEIDYAYHGYNRDKLWANMSHVMHSTGKNKWTWYDRAGFRLDDVEVIMWEMSRRKAFAQYADRIDPALRAMEMAILDLTETVMPYTIACDILGIPRLTDYKKLPGKPSEMKSILPFSHAPIQEMHPFVRCALVDRSDIEDLLRSGYEHNVQFS